MDHDCTSNVRIRTTHPTGSIATDIEESVRVGIGTARPPTGREDDGDLGNLEDFSDVADQSLGGHSTGTAAIVDVVGSAVIGTAEDSSVAGIVQSRWIQQGLVFSGMKGNLQNFRQGRITNPGQVVVGCHRRVGRERLADVNRFGVETCRQEQREQGD